MPSVSARQHRTMEAAAHSQAFARKVGIPQSVGRDFINADKAAGKFQPRKASTTMTKHPHGGDKPYGHESGAMAGGEGMSPRKAMASGKTGSGDFGVEQMDRMGTGHHPDHTAHTGMKAPMEDHERGIGMPIEHTKGHMPAQAAPDHGPHHPGGHGRHHRREPMA